MRKVSPSKRILMIVLPVLVLVETWLVWSGRLDFGDAVLVVVGVEALIILVGIGEVALVVRRYRCVRGEGLDVWDALVEGFSVLLPRSVAKYIVFEVRLPICIVGWLRRRGRFAENEFTYHRTSSVTPFVLLVLFAAPAEILFFELLIPYAWLRWVLLIASLYGVLWVCGSAAALATLPHRLEERGLRLRHGLFAEGNVPYSIIASVKRGGGKPPKQTEGLHVIPEDAAAYFVVGTDTNLTLKLREKVVLDGFFRKTTPVDILYLRVDDPKDFQAKLKHRLKEQMQTTASPGEENYIPT